MKPNVGLNDKQRAGVVALLMRTLADQYVLYTKTRNYHWNVTGPHFNALHKFFESQYGLIDGRIDEIAEFIRFFGEKAPASLNGFLALTRLDEPKWDDPDAPKMIANLLADHEALISSLREDVDKAAGKYKAADVADFLTGLLEDHLKMAWMLRSMLT
ncbi:MAG: DNA starvation/stationary phase protection protein [Acidobacteria bacterium]|nr:DNA starvation/stationary phase protection protein [Acidobacteriota bacterium]